MPCSKKDKNAVATFELKNRELRLGIHTKLEVELVPGVRYFGKYLCSMMEKRWRRIKTRCDIEEGAFFLPSDARLKPATSTYGTCQRWWNEVNLRINCQSPVWWKRLESLIWRKVQYSCCRVGRVKVCHTCALKFQDRDQRNAQVDLENSTTNTQASLQHIIKVDTHIQHSKYISIPIRGAHGHLAVDLAVWRLPQP